MRRVITSLALILAVAPLAVRSEVPVVHDVATKPVFARLSTHPVTVNGAPDQLRAVIDLVYNRGDLRGSASPYVVNALGARRSASGPVNATAALGTWKGTPVAVVTFAGDVTLAVKTTGWVVVGGWWPSLGISRRVLGGTRRVLAIGGDAREDGASDPHGIAAGTVVNRSRADSLHIIGFDGRGGAGMLGIPRDTYAKLSTGGPKQKINGAMPKGGPRAQQKTVSWHTGVALEGYILTGFKGYSRMINLLGPLRISMARRVQILDRPSSRDIPKGRSTLYGAKALDLARARKHVPGGDFGRSLNQGWIMLFAAAGARVAGPRALPGLMTKASPYLETNLTPARMLTFLANLYRVTPLKVVNKVATGRPGSVRGRYVVYTDSRGYAMFRDIRDGNLHRW